MTLQLAHYLGLLHHAQTELAGAFREVGAAHRDEPDVASTCARLAGECETFSGRLQPFAERYGEDAEDEPERLHSELFRGTRRGSLALLRDLHDLYLMSCECSISWTMIRQASHGARDPELLELATAGETVTAGHIAWITTRMKQAAPQALVVG
jgi:hypothetical protein